MANIREMLIKFETEDDIDLLAMAVRHMVDEGVPLVKVLYQIDKRRAFARAEGPLTFVEAHGYKKRNLGVERNGTLIGTIYSIDSGGVRRWRYKGLDGTLFESTNSDKLKARIEAHVLVSDLI